VSTIDLSWLSYPICVPFGDPNFDVALGGSHDMDLATPPNTPITNLLPGIISSIDAPTWGITVGIQLHQPYNGIPYFAYLHMAAANPVLSVGSHVNVGDLIGWSGGCTDAAQYDGTSNPTGSNFLDDPSQSSQPQTGLALMRGSEYGGIGWENFPPIDWQLDPTSIVWRARAAILKWSQGVNPAFHGGIGTSWFTRYLYGQVMPPATTGEYNSENWGGAPIIVREFGAMWAEWLNGNANWYHY